MLLQLKSVQKHFGGVAGLGGAHLDVSIGEVHLLMGQNGAGKSTLMKIVAGMLERDNGEMLWQGRSVRFRSPAEAALQGIAMVHQESMLAPHLSVAENIFLGREPRLPLGWVNRREMMQRAQSIIEKHHFPLQARWRVDKISPG